MTRKWNFPPTGGGIWQGLFGAGKETFTGDPFGNTVREIVQNSLDARKEGVGPVRIEISERELDVSDFCGEDLLDHFSSCISECEAKEHGNAKKMIKTLERGEDKLKGDKIRCLAFVDMNTTGLEQNNWDAITSEGAVYKSSESPGGSFGIGKDAPFLLSDIYSIVYSTRCMERNNLKGRVEKMVGISKLMTHTHNGHPLQSVGFFPGRDNPFISNDIPAPFRLNETGTGVFILGFDSERHISKGSDDNLTSKISKVVCRNFFRAIHMGDLEIVIRDDKGSETIIEKENLSLCFKQNMESEKKDKFLDYAYFYQMASLEEPIIIVPEEGDDFGGLDSIRFYFKLDEGAPSRVAFVNYNGMLITDSIEQRTNPFHPKKKFAHEFAAFIMPATPSGDSWVTEMHNPSHDEIRPDHLDDADEVEKRSKQLFSIRKKIASTIENIVKEEISEIENLSELAEFLAETSNSGDGKLDDKFGIYNWSEISDGGFRLKTPTVSFTRENDPPDPPGPGPEPPVPPHPPGPTPNPPKPKPPIVSKEENFRNPRVTKIDSNFFHISFSLDCEKKIDKLFLQIRPRGFEFKRNNTPLGIKQISQIGEGISVELCTNENTEYLDISFPSPISQMEKISFQLETIENFYSAIALDLIEIGVQDK